MKTNMDERTAVPSLNELLLVLFRRQRLILTIYGSVVLIAIASIFILPPNYRAASKVLLTSNRAQISTSSEKPTELIRGTSIGQPEINSEVEILHSRDLISEVLKAMTIAEAEGEAAGQLGRTVRAIAALPARSLNWIYRRLHPKSDASGSPLYWRVTAILLNLEVAPVRASNVLEIAFTGPDPIWARQLVDRVTNAYLERHASMQREGEAEGFFTSQSELLRQKLANSEVDLRALREKAGTLAGQQAEVHERLNEFSAEFERTKIARSEQEQRVAFLERSRTGGQVATPELLALEAKRADYIGRYRPDSQRVREIDAQIRALRTAVASYGSGASPGEGSATDLMAARAVLQGLKGKEEGVARARDEYRRQAEMLDAQNFDLVRVERQVKLDEEAYLSYVRTAEQSRLSNALEQSKMLRLNVVEPASVALEPVSPRKGRILFFAFFGGLVLALGIGFLRDQLDGTVKTAADVQRQSGLDVLTTVPDRAGYRVS